MVQRKQSGLARSLMPLAASLMGVAAVGWVAHTLYAQSVDTRSFAAAESPVQVVKVPPPRTQDLVRSVGVTVQGDPHREYLFAHQTMTGGGPLSGAIQHVRTVSDVRQDFPR
jgi:sigma-E factor negative regulatory protein RseA